VQLVSCANAGLVRGPPRPDEEKAGWLLKMWSPSYGIAMLRVWVCISLSSFFQHWRCLIGIVQLVPSDTEEERWLRYVEGRIL
jgi:hypothetical protein